MTTDPAPAPNPQSFGATAWDMMRQPSPWGEAGWVIPNFLPWGRFVVYARAKAGKSFVMMQIAHGLERGEAVCGLATPRRRFRVCYVQLDAGWTVMRDQLIGLYDRCDFHLLHYQHPNPLYQVPRYPLRTPGGYRALQEGLKRCEPEYVVFDGLTFMDLVDFNSRTEVLRLYDRTQAIWQGPSTMIAHANSTRESESRHVLERLSGSKVLVADCDGGLFIDAPSEVPPTWWLWTRLGPDRTMEMRRLPNGGWAPSNVSPMPPRRVTLAG